MNWRDTTMEQMDSRYTGRSGSKDQILCRMRYKDVEMAQNTRNITLVLFNLRIYCSNTINGYFVTFTMLHTHYTN